MQPRLFRISQTNLRTHSQTLADANKEPPLELLHGEWYVGYLRLVQKDKTILQNPDKRQFKAVCGIRWWELIPKLNCETTNYCYGWDFAFFWAKKVGFGRSYRLVQAYRPNFIQCRMSTPFFIDSEILNTSFIPLPNRWRMGFLFFFRQIFVFLWYLGLEGITYFRRKQNNKKSWTVWQGHTKHVREIPRSYLSKTAWTFGPLCGKRAEVTVLHRNYLVSV